MDGREQITKSKGNFKKVETKQNRPFKLSHT